MTGNALVEPFVAGRLRLPNRIVMAPMTRGRADDVTGVPHPLTGLYYRQRAQAGLIVSEGVAVNPMAKNGPGIPGLYTPEQVTAWKEVVAGVHEAGGRIFAQLWHAGRVSHPLTLPGGRRPLAPSAVSMRTPIFTRRGRRRPVAPEAMSPADIDGTIDAFASAAREAVSAGFDGVELHGANGYLIHQFLADNTNRRVDRYGGANRVRFPLEVVEAVAAEVGADRVGLRLSPGNPENDLVESDPGPVYRTLVQALRPLGLAYLHVLDDEQYPAVPAIRGMWDGVLIANPRSACPGTREAGERLLREGADLVSFGRLFIANPDLPHRFATGAPLASAPKEHYYGAQVTGYVDYPALCP